MSLETVQTEQGFLQLMRLTGFEAIEYAEKEGLKLNKHPDSHEGPRVGLSIAEAEAIGSDDPELILGSAVDAGV